MSIARHKKMRRRGARESDKVVVARIGSEPGCYVRIGMNRGEPAQESDVRSDFLSRHIRSKLGPQENSLKLREQKLAGN